MPRRVNLREETPPPQPPSPARGGGSRSGEPSRTSAGTPPRLAAPTPGGGRSALPPPSPRGGGGPGGRGSTLLLGLCLLALPAFLLGRPPADAAQLAAGLRLTGAFLRRHLFDASDRPMPEARDRLLARLARATEP